MIKSNERRISFSTAAVAAAAAAVAAAATAAAGVRQKICLNLSLKTMIFCSSQSPLLLLR